MAKVTVDVVKQDVLIWARESIGLTQEEAAKKLDMSLVELRMLEEGPESPTIGQLRKMVNIYKRPLAALLLPEPPRNTNDIKDFRLLPGKANRSYSSTLTLAFRRAYMQREVAQELAEMAEEMPAPLDLSISIDDNPEVVGEEIRAWLGEPVRKDDLNQWITLVEVKAILVIQIKGVAVDEMRGCSISDQPFPVIMLNGKDSSRGKIFTLMHELTHIILRSGGLCNLEQQRPNATIGSVRIERFCNRVAASILMPRTSVLRDPQVAQSVPETRWSDEDLKRLADKYGVSREAMLLRLIELDRATWDYYYSKRIHVRLVDNDEQDKSGHPGYYRTHLRDYGRLYVSAVLDAYHRRDITGSELSDYLNIKVNNLPGLEAELGKRR